MKFGPKVGRINEVSLYKRKGLKSLSFSWFWTPLPHGNSECAYTCIYMHMAIVCLKGVICKYIYIYIIECSEVH